MAGADEFAKTQQMRLHPAYSSDLSLILAHIQILPEEQDKGRRSPALPRTPAPRDDAYASPVRADWADSPRLCANSSVQRRLRGSSRVN